MARLCRSQYVFRSRRSILTTGILNELNRPVYMQLQSRKLVLEFTKMSGTGNDFIVIDNRFYHFSGAELSDMAKNLCRRRLGVGADGLLALGNAVSEDAHFRMSYYNADGSLGTMCGNGARCLTLYAWDAGIQHDVLVFDSDAGQYAAQVRREEGVVRLFVPPPRALKENFKLDSGHELEQSGCHYIWTGTEHLVVEVDDVAKVDVPTMGKKLRFDPSLQPTGANVNFVAARTTNSMDVRTFEKGVEEETLACGTGSIASALVGFSRGLVSEQPVTLHMPGGDLSVGWEGSPVSPTNLFLEGAVEVIYRATTEI